MLLLKLTILIVVFFQSNLSADPFDGPKPFGMGVLQGSVVIGDMNNDGYQDLIVSGCTNRNSPTTRRLDTYLNDGFGNLTGPAAFGTNVYFSSIASGDIDSDGDQDLIITGFDRYNDFRLDKYINNGTGAFSGPFPFGRGVRIGSVALSDIDGDGDPDLIITGSDGGGTSQLIRYINDGHGVFTSTSFGVSVHYSSVALGDINNDGNLDLVVSGLNTGGSGVRLDKYINNGTGSFTGTAFGESVYRGSLALGDLDNDGDLDLIVTGRDSINRQRSDRYLNDGSGNFTGPSSFGIKVYWSSIALADLDNNSALDVITTGTTNEDVFYYRRLDKYMNLESSWNSPPSKPEAFQALAVGNSWAFNWNTSIDDHTAQNMIRYNIAIGTNRGVYNICSTNIDYPRGQANIGNVPLSSQRYFQTAIPVNKTIYYKVCALDTSFAASGYSAEQTATLAADLLYPMNIDVSSARPDFQWKKKQVETNLLQISVTGSNMSSIFFQTNLGAGTNFQLNRDLPAGSVWWRVIIYRQSCVSYFTSASVRFTVDQALPVVIMDQTEGVYTCDLSVTISAFKDSAAAVLDSGADIIGSVYRNDLLWMTYDQKSPLRIELSGPAKYRLQFYARDEAGNSGQPATAEYTLVSGLKSGAAVYPAVLDLNRTSLLKFVSAEKPVSVDIKIMTLKGVLIKEFKNINMSSGAYEWNINDPSLFPAGQYIVKVGSRRTVFVIVK